MNQERENFEQLRRLLKLKRYEQPPPRYFNDFSSQVIARIRKGERGDASTPATTWFERFWSVLHGRPAYSGIFGAAICAALIGATDLIGRTGVTFVGAADGPSNDGQRSSGAHFLASATNPVIQLPSLFDQIAPPNPVRAGFTYQFRP